MHTDKFLKIGSSHKMCEDYIISADEPYPYVILADGCSSSKDTDVGARILVHSAKIILDMMRISAKSNKITNDNYDTLGWLAIRLAKSTLKHIELPPTCLDTTLIILFQHNDKFYVFMYGDGGFAYKTTNGVIYGHIMSYDENAPYYLSYWDDDKRKESYKSIVQNIYIQPYNEQIKSVRPFDTPLLFMFDIKDIDTIAIFSDGVESFMELSTKNFLTEAFNFKTTTGEFVQRRLRRLVKETELNGDFHYDDIAFGAIHVDRGE